MDPNANLIFGAVVDEALHDQVSIISQHQTQMLNCETWISGLRHLFITYICRPTGYMYLAKCLGYV